MNCPHCGAHTHRSHSRHAGEALLKFFTWYKSYRCSECRWRGLAARPKSVTQTGLRRTLLAWAIGIALALAVGSFAIMLLSGPDKPRQKVTGPKR